MKDLFAPAPKKSRNVPFEFVLDLLAKVRPATRPMFGCEAVYVGEKIVLILRDRESYPADNGVWVAVAFEHVDSVLKEFPSLRGISLFDGMSTAWRNLPVESESFEADVTRVCELIVQGDKRIGKIPKSKAKARSRATEAKKAKQKFVKKIAKKKAAKKPAKKAAKKAGKAKPKPKKKK